MKSLSNVFGGLDKTTTQKEREWYFLPSLLSVVLQLLLLFDLVQHVLLC